MNTRILALCLAFVALPSAAQPCVRDTDCPGALMCDQRSCVGLPPASGEKLPAVPAVRSGPRPPTADPAAAPQAPASTRSAPPPAGCTSDRECKAGRICVEASCRPGCAGDSDCKGGRACVAARCVAR